MGFQANISRMKYNVFCLLFGCALTLPADKIKQYALEHPNTNDKPMYNPDLFEGDIVLSDEEQLEIDQFNAMTSLNRRWPTKTIPYLFRSGAFSSSERNVITNAMAEMVSRTRVNGQKCIDIRPVRSGESAYVYLEKGNGCYSAIGRTGSWQTLSLGNGCVWNGIVQHEFLHAWGFYHEQNRNDRDGYVYINYNNIQKGMEHNFAKYSTSQIDSVGTSYNYRSIMHYDAYAFAIDRSVPTIIPHDPNADISYKDYMSELDIERLQIFYCCIRPRESKYFKHLEGKFTSNYCSGLTPPQ